MKEDKYIHMPGMASLEKHADHDYIVARQERYAEAWRSLDPERIMSFMDPKDLSYSCFGPSPASIPYSPSPFPSSISPALRSTYLKPYP